MSIKSISGITCLVKDLEKTAAFYDALGFRVGKQEDGLVKCYVNWFWVDFIAEDQADTSAYQAEAQVSNRGAGQYLHLKVDNVDAFYESILSNGMKPDGAPEGNRSSGRSFVLRDPDGYKLVFFEKK
ncbi:MAG: VOC family protein [Anaerolineae bacterium]|nr:VOC family protein [Anaerolineae bacterium]